jgi:hypothetical protein
MHVDAADYFIVSRHTPLTTLIGTEMHRLLVQGAHFSFIARAITTYQRTGIKKLIW